MPFVLVLLMLLGVSADAQTPRKRATQKKSVPAAKPAAPATAPASEWPIRSITVEGNKLYPADRIIELSGLRVGQLAGKVAFEAARDRLLATGAFDNVGYKFEPGPEGKQYVATLQVTEIVQVFPIRAEGLQVDMKALQAFLRTKEPMFGDRIPATKPVLDRFAGYVAEFTKQSRVLARLQTHGDDLAIVFQPASLTAVAEVDFKGNRVIPTKTLQATVSGAAIGAAYTEERFREILDTSLRPVYEQQGRIRVSFPKITTAPAPKVSGLAVTVTVDEGEEYKLRAVKLTGAPESLLKEAAFRKEERANFTQIQEGIVRIEQAMKRRGYIDVATKVDRIIDDKEKAVDLSIAVTPGPQYKFGKLTIEGLDIQTEPHIRKLWAMKPGQAFDSEYPNYFLARMKADDLFENLGDTKATTKRDDKNEIVDVTLNFKASGKSLPTIGPMSPKERAKEREERRKQGDTFPPF